MAAPRIKHFTVQGRSHFPIDMLRYDGAHPFLSSDSAEIERSFDTYEEGEFRVRLESENYPTALQWAQHGWYVVEGAKP